jgi:predicted MFS family arabinose efflux permease
MSELRERRRTGGAVVAVCVLAIGAGTSPAFLVGFLGPVLQEDLGLSRTALGLLIGLFFGATGVGSVPAGRLTEAIGARRTVLVAQALLVLALGVPAVAPVYAALVVAVLVSGLGYALVNVATNVAVVAALPVSRHGVGLAAKTAGVPATVALTSFGVPALGAAVGWRPVLIGALPVVVLVALATALVLPDARGGGARTGSRTPLPQGFWRFPLAAVLLIAGSQALYSWAVPYLHDGVGASVALAGVLTAVASLVAVGPMLATARLADRLGPSRRLPVAAALAGITALVQAVLALAGGPALAAVALTVATSAQLAAVSMMHASVVAVAPSAVGRASGATMAGFYVGALVAAPMFGLIVDLTGSFGVAWAVGAALTGAAALCFAWARVVGR